MNRTERSRRLQAYLQADEHHRTHLHASALWELERSQGEDPTRFLQAFLAGAGLGVILLALLQVYGVIPW